MSRQCHSIRYWNTPKHATRCIVIYGGLDAATVNLPAIPLTRQTSFLGRRWVAQGCAAKLEPAVLHMAATGAAWVVLPQRLARVLTFGWLAWCSSPLPSTSILLHPRSLALSSLSSAACCPLSFVYICPIACCYRRSLCYYYRSIYHYHYHSCSVRLHIRPFCLR